MLVRSLACCALGLLGSTALGAPFTLVRDGEPVARIALAAEPTQAARFAAAELQLHVRLITGATLPIVPEAEAGDGPLILVGEGRRSRALGLRSSDFDTQEYAIRFAGDDLVLIGRDKPRGAGGGDGMPVRVEGRFGRAAEFGGTSDYLSLPDVPFGDDAGSLEAWVFLPKETQPSESTLLRLDGHDPWTYHILRRWPDTSSLGYTTYDGQTVRSVSSGELADGWHHVLATYDAAAGRAELFVDGASQGTTEFAKTTCAGATLHIGGIAPGATGNNQVANPFAGLIDEVRLSSVARAPGAEAPFEPDDDTVLLLHLDEESGGALDASGRSASALTLPGWFDERGTLDATYDFLERLCGVRWYMPTDIGTAYPERKTLVVEGQDVRRAPNMIHRWITPTALYLPTKGDRVSQAENDLWRLRMRIGGQAFWVCHSFGGYPERFWKDHPEWFAQGYEGTPTQLCYTNEALVQQVAQDARDFFDGKSAQPGASAMGDVFGIVPMDDNRWCKCPRCQAELDASEADNPQFSNGKASRYIWGFVNRVAAEVRKTHPGKWIGALAYWEYAYHPKDVDLEPNVLVQMCLHTRNWWCPSMERNDRLVFDSWVGNEGKRRPLYLWLYYNFPALQSWAEKWNCFPSYFAHTAIGQMAMYREAGLRGIFMEHSCEFGESHLIDVPDMYLSLRLADNPDLGGEALLDEFFPNFYGPAAEPMREAYLLIEEAYGTPANYPVEIQESAAHQHQTEVLAWKWLGTEERLARLSELMADARSRASTDLERQRVDLFASGIVDYMLEGKRQYEAKQKPGG